MQETDVGVCAACTAPGQCTTTFITASDASTAFGTLRNAALPSYSILPPTFLVDGEAVALCGMAR